MASPAPVTRVPKIEGANAEERHRRAHDQIANFIDSLVNAGIFVFLNGGWVINPAIIPRPIPPFTNEDQDGMFGAGSGASIPGPPGPAGRPGSPIFISMDVNAEEGGQPAYPPAGASPLLVSGEWLNNSVFSSIGSSVLGGDASFGVLMIDENGRLATGDGTLYWDVRGTGPFGRNNFLYLGGDGSGGNGGFAFWDDSGAEYVAFYTDGGNLWEMVSEAGIRQSFQVNTIIANTAEIYGSISIDFATGGNPGSNVTVTAHASQSGNLHEWRSSGSTLYSRLNKAGYFGTSKTSAPADADVSNSEILLWYDATTSEQQLMSKAKTSGGTVQSGPVCSTWPLRVVTAAGAVTATATDGTVVVNKTVGAATTVNLPASPITGKRLVVKDGKGDAAANNITLTPAAGNIDGAGTFVMNVNYQCVEIQYNGTEWNIIGDYP